MIRSGLKWNSKEETNLWGKKSWDNKEKRRLSCKSKRINRKKWKINCFRKNNKERLKEVKPRNKINNKKLSKNSKIGIEESSLLIQEKDNSNIIQGLQVAQTIVQINLKAMITKRTNIHLKVNPHCKMVLREEHAVKDSPDILLIDNLMKLEK